ncbi:AEC family transporter [Nostocoides sp.]|jgi:predicted permease|uniref:AEC family transporter n=1 Tax=Nostocoides sp. TaxID=1917966 RepID=UPI002C0CD22C|nr:AEC family transporter [Tetrasphaera sp.]
MMALIRALLDVIVPVILVAGVGAILGRAFTLDRSTITKVALNALTPALALQTMLTTQVSGRVGMLLALAFVVLTAIAALLGWIGSVGSPGRTRRSAAVAVAIGNNGNMGLPIGLFALGQQGLDQSVLIFVLSVIMTFVLAPLLFGAHEGWRAAIRGMLRLPTLWALALGGGIRLAGIEVPTGIGRGIELLAAATLPMILLTLGIQLGSTGRVRLTRPVVISALLRVAVLPTIALPLGYALGLRETPLQAFVLSAAMPTAVNAYILASEYDGDVTFVAHTVTVTTVASFLGAAVVTALLPWIGALG